ncbi:MAG: peptidylprolyl isomerase [Rhodospirillaceae bacterium]|nr:peptidylprolyl isomerase [Rhodospirillaceae bacterium]
MRYRYLGAAALAGLLGVAGYGILAQDKGAAPAQPAAGEAQAAPSDQADDPVVATVNGETLRRSDVIASARSLPPQYQQEIDKLFPALVERLIDLHLLTAEAKKEGLEHDEEVEDKVARYREQAMRETLIDRYLHDQITDDKVKARYDELVKATPPEEEVHAHHILVDSEDKAKEIIKKLDAGEKFEDLAKANSSDGSAQNGGDLGYFTKDQMVPEFAEAAFALKPGEYTKTPVKTDFGWHVIRVDDRREKPAPTLDEVRPQIEQDLARSVIAERVTALRKDAKIERFNPDGTPMSAPAPEDDGSGAAPAGPPAQ